MVRVATAPALAALLTLGGCAQMLQLDEDEALTLVPYELDRGGRILVDVLIDDQGPYAFALDSAASISFVFDDVRNALALEVLPDTSATVHGAVASGRFPVVTVGRIQVGDEVWTGARLVALPGRTEATAAIAGILGIDFLRQYGVGFSARDRVVRLYPPSLIGDRSYRGWTSVPLVPVAIGNSGAPLYFLEVEMRESAVPALFDLGAGLNLMNMAAARELRLAPRNADEGLLSGVLAHAPVLARLSEAVSTGGVRWRNEEFLIADAEIFATLLYADRPLAIVGAGMFNQRDFVIDFMRNRLLINTAMGEADAPASDASAP